MLGLLLGTTLSLVSALSPGGAQAVRPGDQGRSISGQSEFAPNCDPANARGFGGDVDHMETAPHLAVDPTNPDNIAVAWAQDGNDGIVVAVSHDGGDNWSKKVPPMTSVCAGGDYTHAFNPHLSFGPDGRLYLSTWNHVFFVTRTRITVHTSTDAGDTWSQPVSVKERTTHDERATDHYSWVVADPTRPGTAYASWMTIDDVDTSSSAYDMGIARSADGGARWEELDIGSADPGHDRLLPQVVVLPDGSLVNVFLEGPDWRITELLGRRGDGWVMAARSADQGETWSEPVKVARREVASDEDARARDLGMVGHSLVNIPAVANDGTIYYAWPSNEPDDSTTSGTDCVCTIQLTSSSDGGVTWTSPSVIRESSAPMGAVNVAVAPNGRLGVLFYDLRNDVPETGSEETDVWFMSAPRGQAQGPEVWTERHLAGPFDLSKMPGGEHIGSNQGLSGMPRGFVAAYTLGKDLPTTGPTDIFFSRLHP